jgi:rubredoxin
MENWFEVTLRLPKILQFTDEEMEAHFWQLDGRWSKQTKMLVAKHGAKGLNLNRNWAFTAQWWSCPSCGREKEKLVRLSSNETLFACLELHHDHLRDAVGLAFNESAKNDDASPFDRGRAELSTKRIVERFFDTTVCADCNAADGKAKTSLAGEIDPDFSFSPSEIKQFITATDNSPHQVNLQKAHEIWSGEKVGFEKRKSIISYLIEQLASGSFRGEQAHGGRSIGIYWLRPAHFLESSFKEAMSLSPTLEFDTYSSFLARSVINESAASTATKKKAAAIHPSDAEFQEIDQTMSQAFKEWRMAPPDWRCPCCYRSKRELPRKSNAGKWTARIYGFSEYVYENDSDSIELRRELYSSYVAEPIIGNVQRLTLCQDCYLILTQVKTRRPDIGNLYLTVADIQSSILHIEPNANHDRDLSIVEERAQSNHALSEAILAFNEHRAFSNDALACYKIARKSGCDDGQSRAYAAIKLEAEKFLPGYKLAPYIDWLIQEGVRLRWPSKSD